MPQPGNFNFPECSVFIFHSQSENTVHIGVHATDLVDIILLEKWIIGADA